MTFAIFKGHLKKFTLPPPPPQKKTHPECVALHRDIRMSPSFGITSYKSLGKRQYADNQFNWSVTIIDMSQLPHSTN